MLWTGGSAVTRPTAIALVGLAAALLATGLSYVHTHLGHRRPGRNFLYAQAILDVALVTGIVHITGGSESVFPPLFYVALVSAYALLLPFGPALLVGALSAAAYLGEIAFGYPEQLGPGVLLQVAIFTGVATASAAIGGRLRQARDEVRRLEGELHRLRLDTAHVLRSIGSGVFTVDREGRLAYLNPAGEELLELDAASWLGRDLLAELDGRAPAIAGAVRRTFLRRRPVRSLEVAIRTRDGSERPASVTTTLIQDGDGEPSVTAALQDLGPARRLEELRLRTGRLEAVAELSASLAHEIKNPLASIRSAAQQLGDTGLSEDDRTLTRLMVREADRLNGLLEEFGDFARVRVTDRRPLELGKLVTHVFEALRQHPDTPESTRLELAMETDAGDLWGDPDLLYQLLWNLCLNAVQVQGPGASPHLRVVVDEIRAELEEVGLAQGAPVRIRVVDDGPGIPPGQIRRIFDPFYSGRAGGSGMGLSVAHRAAEAHGGALFASSRPGEGATFVLVLPRRDRVKDGDIEWQRGDGRTGTEGGAA